MAEIATAVYAGVRPDVGEGRGYVMMDEQQTQDWLEYKEELLRRREEERHYAEFKKLFLESRTARLQARLEDHPIADHPVNRRADEATAQFERKLKEVERKDIERLLMELHANRGFDCYSRFKDMDRILLKDNS